MKPWICAGLMVVATSLLACKNDACPAARKTASTEVVEAIDEASLEWDKLQRKAEEAKYRVSQLAENEKGFLDDLKLFEQAMGCLEHADCCARLGRMSYPDRASVWSSGMKVTRVRSEETQRLPGDLEVVLQKYSELIGQDGMGLNNSDPKVVMTWCTSIRDEIAKIRKDAPPIWKRAVDDAPKQTAEVDGIVAAHQRRIRALGDWAAALKESKKPTLPADLANGASSFERARESVKRYQSACH
jgi:hypothetical protein